MSLFTLLGSDDKENNPLSNPPGMPNDEVSIMNVNGLSVSTASLRSSKANATEKSSVAATDNQVSAVSSETGIKAQSVFSTLARQLADAAARAETRDATLSRNELKTKAESVLKEITDANYYTDSYKKIYDAEVPDTTDPDLLARAKQATDFLNGKTSNPFKGMSREQLSLITYDDSGTFTVNERRAAWNESNDQYEAWAQKVVAKAMAEYNRTGKITQIYSDMLEFYQSQPAIEQAQYPAGYEAQLQVKISLSSSSSATNDTFLFNTLNNWKNELQETFPISPDESFHPAWQ